MLQRALLFFGRSPEAASASAGGSGGGDRPPGKDDIIPTLEGKLPAESAEEDEDEDQDIPDPMAKKARTASTPPWRVPEPAGLPPPRGKWAFVEQKWVRVPAPPSTPPRAADSVAAGATGDVVFPPAEVPAPTTPSDAMPSPPWQAPPHHDLRECWSCKNWSYLRKQACVNSECVLCLQALLVVVIVFMCMISKVPLIHEYSGDTQLSVLLSSSTWRVKVMLAK